MTTLVGMDDLVVDDIVGDRQQGADEDAVAFGAFGQPGVAVRRRRQLLGIEAALGAGRHDHRVLDQLRLHQAEDLGAEIVAPVGPAQAAAGDRAAAQVDALDARANRPRSRATAPAPGRPGTSARIELEGERLGGRPARRRWCAAIASTTRAEQPQDAVVVDRRDLGEARRRIARRRPATLASRGRLRARDRGSASNRSISARGRLPARGAARRPR